jgi:uncharacterized protein
MRLLKRYLFPALIFVILTAILATLGNAMMPRWDVQPLSSHIKVDSADTSIQARDISVAQLPADIQNAQGQQSGVDDGGSLNTPADHGARQGETNSKAADAVLKTPQEGTYQIATTNLHIKLAPNVTVNAILRSPVGAPGKRPAALFIHGAGTGKASEVYGDIASAMSSAGIVTLVPDKRLDTYSTFHRNYYAMGEDYMTSFNTLRSLPDVDPAQAGIYAESEGTWVAEAMAHRHHDTFAFMMLTSPPTVPGRSQMTMAASAYLSAIDSPVGLKRDVDKFIGMNLAPWGLEYADFPAKRYLNDLTMPLLVSYGTDDLSMPIEQGATNIIEGAARGGNTNVVVRYYHANHQMRVGARTSVPGLPLDTRYTHDLEDWTNAVVAGTKADDWLTPQIAGDKPNQRFAAPESVTPGMVGSLNTVLILLFSTVLCPVIAALIGLGVLLVGRKERHGRSHSPITATMDENTYSSIIADQALNIRRDYGGKPSFPRTMFAALTLNGCYEILSITAIFTYMFVAVKSALTLTPQGTLLRWGWAFLQIIALADVALLTWLVVKLWRYHSKRHTGSTPNDTINTDGAASESFWTPARFAVAALCVIGAVLSTITLAFFGLYSW